MPKASTKSLLINKLKRNQAIQARFEHLYKKERIRYDDVRKQLSEEFFLAESSIMKILAMDLKSE